jgi:hypothetical protein
MSAPIPDDQVSPDVSKPLEPWERVEILQYANPAEWFVSVLTWDGWTLVDVYTDADKAETVAGALRDALARAMATVSPTPPRDESAGGRSGGHVAPREPSEP